MNHLLNILGLMTNVMPYRRGADQVPVAWARHIIIAILSSVLIGVLGGLVGAYTMIISDNARIADQSAVNVQIFSELNQINARMDTLLERKR